MRRLFIAWCIPDLSPIKLSNPLFHFFNVLAQFAYINLYWWTIGWLGMLNKRILCHHVVY